MRHQWWLISEADLIDLFAAPRLLDFECTLVQLLHLALLSIRNNLEPKNSDPHNYVSFPYTLEPDGSHFFLLYIPQPAIQPISVELISSCAHDLPSDALPTLRFLFASLTP